MQLSDRDRALLALLMDDSRMPIAEIARRLGVARTTAQARLERLEDSGVIAGYGVRLSEAHLREQVRAHAMITIRPKVLEKVVAALRAIPEVQAVHSVSGAFDLVVGVAAPSIRELDRVLDAIGLLDGVERTQSSVILSTRFQR